MAALCISTGFFVNPVSAVWRVSCTHGVAWDAMEDSSSAGGQTPTNE